jgi:type I site-specific restriction endonuclease
MNIDPHTGKNYGLPPTADDVRNYAAEVDDRDEATQEQLDMLRLVADRLEQLERERDEMQRELRKAETECSMLRVECGVIAAERDEARRELCKRVESASCLSDGEPTTLASDYARWCGWDCFNKNPTGNA